MSSSPDLKLSDQKHINKVHAVLFHFHWYIAYLNHLK